MPVAPFPEQALPTSLVHPSCSVPAAWTGHGPKSSRVGFSLLSSFISASPPVFYKQEEKPDRVLRASLEAEHIHVLPSTPCWPEAPAHCLPV